MMSISHATDAQPKPAAPHTLAALLAAGGLAGKRVFIRADLNVPQDDAGQITDDTRIRAFLFDIVGNGRCGRIGARQPGDNAVACQHARRLCREAI